MALPSFDTNSFTTSFMTACEDLHKLTSGTIAAATKSSAAAWQGIDDVNNNWSSLIKESVARSVSAYSALVAAKSPQEAADTHAEFVKDYFDGLVAGSGKLSEITLRATKGAIDPIAQHTNESVNAIIKKDKAA